MDARLVRVMRHTQAFDAMVQFYRDKLGMRLVRGWDRPGNRGALLSLGEGVGNAEVEVLELAGLAAPGARPTNVELALEVADVAGWHERLAAAGVEITRGLEVTPWGHRSFGIDDPDGLRIWIYQVVG